MHSSYSFSCIESFLYAFNLHISTISLQMGRTPLHYLCGHDDVKGTEKLKKVIDMIKPDAKDKVYNLTNDPGCRIRV